MNQTTVKSAAKDSAKKLMAPVAFSARDNNPYFDSSPILRKSSCACGGGCPACQAKSGDLKVSQPNDAAEIEADQIADKVMRMPADAPVKVNHHKPAPEKLQAKCGSCESAEETEEEDVVFRMEKDVAAKAKPGVGLSEINSVINSGGHPLGPESRSFFEPRFGIDFGNVRIHSDARAAASAKAVNARAYTVGHNIVFGSGEYQPGHDKGKNLLAHELAHVAQAESASPKLNRSVIYRQGGDEENEGEGEAALTRAEEIELSRTSPGLVVGTAQPVALSLFNFGIDIAQLKPEHAAALDELGQFLGGHASVRVVIRATGFADSSGAAGHNLGLSRRRANAVKARLDPLMTQRVTVSAQGETNPAVSNTTVEGRARNRRVDLRFFANTPPGRQPLPRPAPVPPGQRPGPVPPVPVPPGTEPPGTRPPGGGGGGGDDTGFCEDHPILCSLGVLPFFAPLACLVAPEICLAIACLLQPELCIPPIPPGGGDGPPDPPDDDPPNPRVMFSLIRAPNTPAGMRDRIGIRDTVSVTATVIDPPPVTAPIMIFVSDNNSGAGHAAIDGQAQMNINGTTQFRILGTAMTDERYVFSPYIQLGAWWSNRLIGDSNRFAVSSLAENWVTEFEGAEVTPSGYGFHVKMRWHSDSGSHEDLESCEFVERVGVISEEGGMSGLGTGRTNDPNVPRVADWAHIFDEHGTVHRYATGVAGRQRLKQLFTIRDLRSNSEWAASTNSGFEIERIFERDPANPACWHLIVRKHGAAASVGGWSTGAGAGSASHDFRNINCDPPPPGREDPPPPGHEDPPPQRHDPPGPQAPEVCCDRPEMARRVDQCIENARDDVIDCHYILISPFPIESAPEYLLCLEMARRELERCDQRAKRETNCPDVNTPPDCAGGQDFTPAEPQPPLQDAGPPPPARPADEPDAGI